MPKRKSETTDVVDLTPAPAERTVIYAEPQVQLCVGEDALTVEMAKDLLGWEEGTQNYYLLTDVEGKKIRCLNNTNNRPLTEAWSYTLAQELLRRRWRLNGETIVMGKTKQVISGQHRLIALVLAEQLREKEPHWAEQGWDGPVTMDTIVVFGIDESDDTVQTTDTGKSRTLGDNLYRSELLRKYPPAKRKDMARALDHAVRLLWERTGAKQDAFAPTRTHSEAMDFLVKHPTLLDCVEYVLAEDNNKSITRYLSAGYSGAVCYLMAMSDANPEKYDRTEASVKPKTKLVDKAQGFFMDLGGGASSLRELRDAITAIEDPDTRSPGPLDQRLSMIAKAWAHYAKDETVTAARVKLKFVNDEDGVATLDDHATFGGIDVGGESRAVLNDEPQEDESTVAEIEARKAAVRAESEAETTKPASQFQIADLDRLRTKHPSHVLLVEAKDKYNVFGSDADAVSKHCGVKPSGKKVDGVAHLSLPKSQHQPITTALNEAGLLVAVVRQVDGEIKVERLKAVVKPKKSGK